jgi:putative transposase
MILPTKVRLYPTSAQEQKLSKQFGCARWAWNWALEETRRLYRETGKGLSYFGMTKCLPKLKDDNPWLMEADAQVLQQSLRHLACSFRNFFEKNSGYPRFKNKRDRQSIQFPQRVSLEGNFIYLPKVGWVRAVIHRPIIGHIKTVTVSKSPCGHFFASILTDREIFLPEVNSIGPAIGVDVGIAHLAITSDGSKFDNLTHIRRSENNLAIKQKKMDRKILASKSHERARIMVAKVHQKVANQRRDYLHKISRRIVDENQVISVEQINTKMMLKNRHISKSVADAGWGYLCNFLEYKSAIAGKIFIRIGRFYPSSKSCSVCGFVADKMPLKIRSWTCPSCKTLHDRDVNAAKNIRDEGLRMLAAGIVASAGGGNVRRKSGRKSSTNAVAVESRSSMQDGQSTLRACALQKKWKIYR